MTQKLIIAWAVWTIILIGSAQDSGAAATTDQYITCAFVYGALFEGSKNACHDGMLQYSRPRIQAVLPFLQQQNNDPVVRSRLKQIATELDPEVKDELPKRVTDALMNQDARSLRQALRRVETCDSVFGFLTYPLPSIGTHDEFKTGLYAGCLAKQRTGPSPFADRQLQRYCSCVAIQSRATGIDAASSSQAIGSALMQAHSVCLGEIQK